MSLTMKAATGGCVLHKVSTNSYYVVQTGVKSSVCSANSSNNPASKSNTS